MRLLAATVCFRQMQEKYVSERKIQLALREWSSNLSPHLIGWVAGSAIAITLCVLIGPFGTDDSLSFMARLGYWGAVVCSASLIMAGVQVVLARVFGFGLLLEALLGSLIFAAVYVPLLILINGWVFTETTIGFGSTFVSVFFISLLIYAVVWLATWKGAETKTLPATTGSVFMRRLSQPPNSILWALMAEDHYVRAITSTGEEMILMRFSDALDEVAALEGAQIHRSTWVAKKGVLNISRENGKVAVTLRNGKQVFASRGFAKAALAVTNPTNM